MKYNKVRKKRLECILLVEMSKGEPGFLRRSTCLLHAFIQFFLHVDFCWKQNLINILNEEFIIFLVLLICTASSIFISILIASVIFLIQRFFCILENFNAFLYFPFADKRVVLLSEKKICFLKLIFVASSCKNFLVH